jgi:hypothetical protein
MAERGAPLGNQNAAKGKRFQKAMERVLARKYGDVDSGYEAIAKIYIEIAESKDPSICKDIADRVDGKPAQAVTLAGDSENPIVTKVVREIVDPSETGDAI